MTAREAVQEEVTVVGLLAATRITDATATSSTALDISAYPHSRFLVILAAFETNTANTGGTWTITESATSGGSYTDATLGGTLTATPAAAGNDVQAVAVVPNAAKPFLKVTYTGADASAEVDITASLVVFPLT